MIKKTLSILALTVLSACGQTGDPAAKFLGKWIKTNDPHDKYTWLLIEKNGPNYLSTMTYPAPTYQGSHTYKMVSSPPLSLTYHDGRLIYQAPGLGQFPIDYIEKTGNITMDGHEYRKVKD